MCYNGPMLHEEIKGKLKEAMMAKDAVMLRAVRNMLSAFTNELVGSFDSITQCAKSLNLCISKISTTLKGRRNYYKNYTFSLNNGSNN